MDNDLCGIQVTVKDVPDDEGNYNVELMILNSMLIERDGVPVPAMVLSSEEAKNIALGMIEAACFADLQKEGDQCLDEEED